MAQAAFFVNDLKITDKGRVLILEARRQCGHGNVIDQIFLTFPAELKHVFAELAESEARDTETPDAAARRVWQNRLEKYFDREN
jgi:hypothetical protein